VCVWGVGWVGGGVGVGVGGWVGGVCVCVWVSDERSLERGGYS
jgi:hypothetical protein